MPKVSKLSEYPTVKAMQEREELHFSGSLDARMLRELCLKCGADDVGFVDIGRSELDDQRGELLEVFEPTQTLISFVCRMNREPVRSKFRSLANTEFHMCGDKVTEVAHKIARELEALGVRAMNEPMAFPMEVSRWPDAKPWVISHKPIAEAAGLGKMGLHRNVIHPKFGNFILLGTVLIDAKVDQQAQPLDYNPCLDCKLCVAACPVGAIGEDGHFDFTACYTHNYREFLGGFSDWVAIVADSKSGEDYHAKVTEGETQSVWQSVSFGPNYKSANCVSVCPAGEDVIGPFLKSRKNHVAQVLKPLQDKEESLYVLAGSDAESYAAKKYPHKTRRIVRSTTKPKTLAALWTLMPHGFQRHKASGLSAIYHFTFSGREPGQRTIVIDEGKIALAEGHHGAPNVRITVDSGTWVKISNQQMSAFRALATRKLRVRGDLRLLQKFSACFVR
jgi:putative sterol carrier protein/Fe-S-cluster-containing hydrogenase component 2